MIEESTLNQLKNIIDSARTIFIIFPQQASIDQKAVAASLYLALIRAQKSVGLVTPVVEANTEEQLSGLEYARAELGNQNLTISFPYTPEQVDKVSYHIGEETGKFFLSIKPKPGTNPLDAAQVEFSYTGASADAVFLVGVKDLENLDQLYFGYEQLYQDSPLISINTYETSFGTIKIDTGNASTSSEVVAQLLSQLDLPLDSDTATNLLYGIETGTKNLSAPTTSADTFETVAQLLRAGARRSFKRAQPESAQLVHAGESVLHHAGDEGQNLMMQVGTKKNGQESAKQKSNKAKNQKGEKKDSLTPPAEYVPKRLM